MAHKIAPPERTEATIAQPKSPRDQEFSMRDHLVTLGSLRRLG
jgi:hypothetical protein